MFITPYTIKNRRSLIGYLSLTMLLVLGLSFFSTAQESNQESLWNRIPYQDRAENFTLYDLDGQQHNLKDYQGKTVLLIFWHVSCQACHFDIVELEVLYQRFKDQGLEIIAIHAGDDLAQVKALPGVRQASYTMLMDMDLAMAAWGIPTIPTAFIIDPQGYRRYRITNNLDWSSEPVAGQMARVMSRVIETSKHE